MSDQILTADPQLTVLQFNLAKRTAELLHQHYPGYMWAVDVNGGMVNVRNINLSGEWGFVLRERDSFSGSDWDRKVMLAGGEILERYKMARAKFDAQGYSDLKVDFAGRHKVEV